MSSPPFHLSAASSLLVPPIEPIPSRRHHHASAPVSIPAHRSPRGSSPTARLLASSSSLSSITPAGHALPASRPALLVKGRGGATGRMLAAGCSAAVALLAYSMPFPASDDLVRSLPSRPHCHLVRSCCFACADDGCVRGGAVRPLPLLPRWSVLIIFKMLPRQCFKVMRLFDMVWICEYRGVPYPVASPSRPSCRYPYPASRFSSPPPPCPSDTISGAEATGRPAACPTGRRTGRAVLSWLSCVHAAAYPLRASDRSPPCRPPYRLRSSVPFPHGVVVRPFSSCLRYTIAPASLHGRRGAGRGECLLGGADRMMCVGLKKAGGDFVPRPLASALSSVDALIVIAHVSLLTDNIAIRSAWTDVRIPIVRS